MRYKHHNSSFFRLAFSASPANAFCASRKASIDEFIIGTPAFSNTSNSSILKSIWHDDFQIQRKTAHFQFFLKTNGLSRFCYLVEWYDIVQNQADFLPKCESSLHEQTLLSGNLFGGYASPRKHIVFSRLALNDLFLPRCVSEAAVQYDWDIHTVWNCLFVCFSITLVKPEKPLKVPEVEKFYKLPDSRAVV